MMGHEQDNMVEVLNYLNRQGYVDDFRAEHGGLRALVTHHLYRPEELVIDATYRFEGETNLEDESVVFALRDPVLGTKGTYVVAYSTDMPELDSDMVPRLH